MINKTSKLKHALILLITLILTTTANSLGVAPAGSEFILNQELVPGAFNIVNDEGRDVKVRLSVDPAYQARLSLPYEETIMSANELLRSIPFTINTQGIIGTFEFAIYIEEESVQNEGITARVKVPHKITLIKPLSEEIHVSSKAKLISNSVMVYNDIWNLANSTIYNLYLSNELSDNTGSLGKSDAVLEELLMKSTTSTKTIFYLPLRGMYSLNTQIQFEGKQFDVSKVVQLGDPEVRMSLPSQAIINQIPTQINLVTDSLWNSQINTEFEYEITSGVSRLYYEKSPLTQLMPGRQVTPIFLNPQNIAYGEYVLSITAKTGGKQIGKFTTPLTYSSTPIKEFPMQSQDYNWLIVIALLLAAILGMGIMILVIVLIKNKKNSL